MLTFHYQGFGLKNAFSTNAPSTVVLSKGTMLQFRRFFDVSNMTFSTFNIKFDIGTKTKVNIFSRDIIF